MAVLGTVAERRTSVRWLAGNLDVADIADTPLDNMLERGDRWMMIGTAKTDWSISDADFETALQVSDYWASAEVEDGIATDKARASAVEHRKAAREMLEALNRKMHEQGSATTPDLYKTEGAEA